MAEIITMPKLGFNMSEGDAILYANSAMDFDIIIIGSGPGGYEAAIKAAQLGKKTAIIEKDNCFGGVCLNRGCIPTKTFLKSVESLKEVRESERFGIKGIDSSGAILNMAIVQERKKSIVSQLGDGVNSLLVGNGVTIINGIGEIQNKHTIRVGEKVYTTHYIIIATGSEVDSIPFCVDPDMNLFTSDDILNLDYIPKDMVILGGGVIAVEFAYFLAGIGCDVSLIVRSRILRTATDEEIGEQVSGYLNNIGIKIYEGAQVKEVTKDSVKFIKDNHLQEIKTSNVLYAVGRKPSLTGIPYEELSIKVENGAIVTDDTMRTSIDNIYAIGDVNGKVMLAHVASMEGMVAVENICGHKRVMDYSKIPGCIYIQPEIASVGLTEKQAKEKYGTVKIGRFPLLACGKAKVAGNENGLIKVILEPKYNEIVGVHLFCIHATDMIAEAVVAMNLESTAEEIANSIHPHPTVSEIYLEAFHAALDKAINYL